MSRCARRVGAGLAGVLVLVTGAALAQVPTPRPTARPVAATPTLRSPAAPDGAVLEAARTGFEALPLAERIAIQDDLVWTGDYTGALDGTFGRMTFESLAAFQSRQRLAPDGILTPAARKALAAAAAPKRAEVGFRSVDDPATGIRLHLPTRLLGPPVRREGGSRWVGRGGAIRIETSAIADGDLARIFEQMKAEAPGRKVVYSVLRPDWFVVSDETATTHGYARFARGPEGIRGFVFTQDVALGPAFDRVVIATAGHFEPFPDGTAASAPAATTAPAAAATASGIVVAPGKVLTAAAAIADCRNPTVAGAAATIATTDAGGLATLTITGGGGEAIATGAAVESRLTVVASDGTRVVAIPGDAVAGRLRAALQPGGQGAAVVDAHGGLVGLVGGRPDERRSIAGLIPMADYDLTPPAALGAAIDAAGGRRGTAAAETRTTGEIAALWAGRVVSIGCRR